MKVLLDANVLIAAFAARGLCADMFRLAATDHELLIGAPVLVEVRNPQNQTPHACAGAQ